MADKVSTQNANGSRQGLRTVPCPHFHLSLVNFTQCFIQNEDNNIIVIMNSYLYFSNCGGLLTVISYLFMKY